MNKARIETFSDGVFAIAITLLVLGIAQPSRYRDLASQLLDRWPSLAAYVVSFAVIGIMWINHHSVLNNLERMDQVVAYLNLALLLTIAFLPYPTSVLGEALAKGEGTTAAAITYGVAMAVNAYAWAALWLYASHRRRLLGDSFPEHRRRTTTAAFTGGTVVYSLAVGIAFLNAFAFLAVEAALAIYYAFDPISQRLAKTR